MFRKSRIIQPLEDRGPLRVMFVITCMPVGGAETLLVDLIRRLDRSRFSPELCCLKFRGPLGYVLAEEIPTFSGLLAHKFDFAILPRLKNLMLRRQIDAVITVGTGGDKMFWGRLAARWAGVPVIGSALHSTGLPDHVELPNRLLAPITDAFIAVAKPHAQYLVSNEGCPADKVCVIVNGVDVERFHPRWPTPNLREELNLPPDAPIVGIVAALRPEKTPRFIFAGSGKNLPRFAQNPFFDRRRRAQPPKSGKSCRPAFAGRTRPFYRHTGRCAATAFLARRFHAHLGYGSQSGFYPRGHGHRKAGRGPQRRIGSRDSRTRKNWIPFRAGRYRRRGKTRCVALERSARSLGDGTRRP